MADKIDPLIEEMLTRYGLDEKDALWAMERKSKSGYVTRVWIMYHSAIEKVAGMAGIVFDTPAIAEVDLAKKVCGMVVLGRMKIGENDYRHEWATGEAAPYNINKIGYPMAMAEKRAKDRVVLKLLGIHGLVYSEEEADDFKVQDVIDQDGNDTGFKSGGKGKSAYAMKKENPEAWNEAVTDIADARSMDELQAVERALMDRFKVQGWPAKWGPELRRELDDAYKSMADFEALQSTRSKHEREEHGMTGEDE